MERHQNRTPRSALVQRRSKSKSYRQSYRSCLAGAHSRLGVTLSLTARRLNASRRTPKSSNIKEKVSPEHLALLVKTRWQLSYVTPLYQFKHTQLKSYSRQLAAFLAAEKQQGLALEGEGTQDSFRVSLCVVQGLAETDQDPETVLIQIHSRPCFMKQGDPPRLVWRGWLTCISGSPKPLCGLPRDFTCLPLFGSSGTKSLTLLVQSWLQQRFDCCVGPLEISQTSLQWLVALWTSCHAQSNIKHLKMLWALPVVPPLQVTLTVNPQDAWSLWSRTREASSQRTQGEKEEEEEEEEAGTINIKEVQRFMQELKSHFYRHFRLDLSAGSLSQVSTALGLATSTGSIKMSNGTYVTTTLALLTEYALLKMPL